MNILAIDTTAKTAAAALTENDLPTAVSVLNGTMTHSETMLHMVETLLSGANRTVSDIDLFAVSSGPGSFTGVRIGVSVIKGLAFGRNVPCVPVSTLEALAENLRPTAELCTTPFYACAVMDARRSQLYTALFLYDKDEDGNVRLTRVTEDDMVSVAALAEQLASLVHPVYFVGEGCRVTEKEIHLPHCREVPEVIRYQSGYSVAAVAHRIYETTEDRSVFTDLALKPSYLRPSQAERERSEGV